MESDDCETSVERCARSRTFTSLAQRRNLRCKQRLLCRVQYTIVVQGSVVFTLREDEPSLLATTSRHAAFPTANDRNFPPRGSIMGDVRLSLIYSLKIHDLECSGLSVFPR